MWIQDFRQVDFQIESEVSDKITKHTIFFQQNRLKLIKALPHAELAERMKQHQRREMLI